MFAVVCQLAVSLMLAGQTSCVPACEPSVNPPLSDVATVLCSAFPAQADDEPSPFDPGDLPPLMSGVLLDDGDRQLRESKKESPRRRHFAACRNTDAGISVSVRVGRQMSSASVADPSLRTFPLRL